MISSYLTAIRRAVTPRRASLLVPMLTSPIVRSMILTAKKPVSCLKRNLSTSWKIHVVSFYRLDSEFFSDTIRILGTYRTS